MNAIAPLRPRLPFLPDIAATPLAFDEGSLGAPVVVINGSGALGGEEAGW